MQDIERVKLVGADTGIRIKRYWHQGYHMHWHNFYEFEIVLQGDGTHTLNNTAYPNRRGDMYFMRITDFHEIDPDTQTEVYRIQVPASCMPNDISKLLSTTYGNLYTHTDEESLNRISALCELLISSCQSEELYDKEYAEQLFSVIVCTFLKLMDSNSIYVSGNSRLVDICSYIQEHFTEEIDVSTIASYFSLNKNYLCTFFKKNTGTTLSGFIRDLRLQYAARLASISEYTSLQICEMSGYGSHSNFLRDFKKRFGVSPLQMRKRK